MLGIVLLYWIGKRFSELAKKLGRKPTGPVILGIVFYYLGQFIFGLIVGLTYELQGLDAEQLNDFVINLIGIPFGLLACWIFYKYLEKKWSKITLNENDILDDEVILQEKQP